MEKPALNLKIVKKVMHILFCKNFILEDGNSSHIGSLMTDFSTYSIQVQRYRIIEYLVVFFSTTRIVKIAICFCTSACIVM